MTNRYLDGIVLNKYDFESIDRDFKSTHKCENNQNEEEDMSSDILSILEQKKQNLQQKKSGLMNRLIKEKEQTETKLHEEVSTYHKYSVFVRFNER